ncbi:Rhamnogalacturonan acetylesterase RhgT [compost metagenome]
MLLTSVSRRRFLDDGSLDPLALGEYPAAMREVADETGAPLLDIFTASQQLYDTFGADGSKRLFMHLPERAHPNYPAGITDDTHFSDEGARQIARLAAEAIWQSAKLSGLKQHLKGEIT